MTDQPNPYETSETETKGGLVGALMGVSRGGGLAVDPIAVLFTASGNRHQESETCARR